MTNLPTALVTGASSGIGREIARVLAENGFSVFGGSRHPKSMPDATPHARPLHIDVTNDESVAAAVQSVVETAGRIDLLVNNAGYALLGALEETSLAEARAQFETNFFGVVRVTQTVLPIMRRQRAGRVINISSVLGFLPAPYWGIYAASKHAVEAFTETLDHEVRTRGLRAILVQPNFTRTDLGRHGLLARASLEDYALQRGRVIETIQHKTATGDDPRLVAQTVLRAATAARPRLRYPVGRGVTLSRLRRFLPARMVDRSLRKEFRMDG
jgi:NAD(P)-dependent dehydrogenase (short-subunit alcohol dehydrogenase family)